MSTEDLVWSWKDPEFRLAGPFASHPAGEIDLGEARGGLPALADELLQAPSVMVRTITNVRNTCPYQ
jgi:hypothetical protein